MPGPSAQGGNAGAEQCWGTMDDVRGCVCWMGSEVVSDGVMREPVLCEEVRALQEITFIVNSLPFLLTIKEFSLMLLVVFFSKEVKVCMSDL